MPSEAPGEYQGAVFGDRDRVLRVGGARAVGRADGPAVGVEDDPVGSAGEPGFEGQGHACPESEAAPGAPLPLRPPARPARAAYPPSPRRRGREAGAARPTRPARPLPGRGSRRVRRTGRRIRPGAEQRSGPRRGQRRSGVSAPVRPRRPASRHRQPASSRFPLQRPSPRLFQAAHSGGEAQCRPLPALLPRGSNPRRRVVVRSRRSSDRWKPPGRGGRQAVARDLRMQRVPGGGRDNERRGCFRRTRTPPALRSITTGWRSPPCRLRPRADWWRDRRSRVRRRPIDPARSCRAAP